MSVSIRLKIKSIYNDLSPKEQKIADYILENPGRISSSPISDLAADLGIADSTFFQFTKKLGYSGFKDFKMAMLVQESEFASISIHENIYREDTELTMAQKVFESNILTLSDTRKLLKQEDLETAASLLCESQRVYFFGVGGSEIVAADAYHKFLRSPVNVSHSSDYHIQLMEASLLGKNDCAVLISHTGRSKETIHIAETLKEVGARTIVITSQANSPLAKLGDVVFISISEETEFRSEALASRISQLSIIDSLYVIVMFYLESSSEDSILKVRHAISNIKEK